MYGAVHRLKGKRQTRVIRLSGTPDGAGSDATRRRRRARSAICERVGGIPQIDSVYEVCVKISEGCGTRSTPYAMARWTTAPPLGDWRYGGLDGLRLSRVFNFREATRASGAPFSPSPSLPRARGWFRLDVFGRWPWFRARMTGGRSV